MGKCVMFVKQSTGTRGWYEAVVTLPSNNDPSSVVLAYKILRFPANKEGEVTEEDFELLERQGYIGEGKLKLVEGYCNQKGAYLPQSFDVKVSSRSL
jgi:hypothetical protein